MSSATGSWPETENSRQVPSDFSLELKQAVLELHTKDLTTSGALQPSPTPFRKWVYTVDRYLKFLVQARHLFTLFENIIHADDSYSMFRRTGLDRKEALEHDIAWISAEHNLEVPSLPDSDPAVAYGRTLMKLSKLNPPGFVAHVYGYYLSHTTPGLMIAKKVVEQKFGGDFSCLAILKYDTEVGTLVAKLKATTNGMASEWSREQKDACVLEAKSAFMVQYDIIKAVPISWD